MNRAIILLTIFFVLAGAPAGAAQVRVLALFPGKALLEVDGQRKVLREGQSLGPARLVAADPQRARVAVDGRVEILRVGSAVASRYVPPQREEIRILREGNAFHLDGLINGQPVRLLVDTGATTVAMSEREARRLGIPYVAEGQGALSRTASGVARGYAVRLRSLKIGNRTFSNVRAIVVQGDYPEEVLLGMNVLAAYEMEHRGNLMILRSRR